MRTRPSFPLNGDPADCLPFLLLGMYATDRDHAGHAPLVPPAVISGGSHRLALVGRSRQSNTYSSDMDDGRSGGLVGANVRSPHPYRLVVVLREYGSDPVTLRGGMGAKVGVAALARLDSQPDRPPLLVVATGPVRRGRLQLPRSRHTFPGCAGRLRRQHHPVGRADPRTHRATPPRRCTTITTCKPRARHDIGQAPPPATPTSASPILAGPLSPQLQTADVADPSLSRPVRRARQ
jgi:hypothetical protein